MDAIRQYLLTVISAAVFCGVLEAIPVKKSGGETLRKLACGVFLAATVVAPLTKLHLSDWISDETAWRQDGMAVTAEAVEAAEAQRNSIIKSSAEAYILDKAAALEVSLTAEVTIGADGTPEEVTLSGRASPYAKQVLSNTISADLAIAKEHQQWIG